MDKERITIKIDQSGMDEPTAKLSIEARPLGECFAYHRYVFKDGTFSKRYWALTHIPTGLAVSGSIPTIKKVKELYEAVVSLLGDWSSDDRESYKYLREKGIRTVSKIVLK